MFPSELEEVGPYGDAIKLYGTCYNALQLHDLIITFIEINIRVYDGSVDSIESSLDRE